MARSRQDADNRPGNSVPRYLPSLSPSPSLLSTRVLYTRMCIYVCVSVNPVPLCESRYIYIYIYIVALIITPVCRSLTHTRVNLRRGKMFRWKRKPFFLWISLFFFSLSLYLCLCFELRFDCVYRVRDTWFRGNELVERSLRENWVIFRPVLILRSYRGLFDIKKGV